MVEQIIFSLLLTLAIELFIYGFADHFRLKSYLIMLGVNIVLNVTMNVILVSLNSYQAYLIGLVIAEVLVFVIEAITFYLFAEKKLWFAFVIAFAANTTSLAIGNLFNQLKVTENPISYYIFLVIFLCLISAQIAVVISFFIKKRSAC